MKIKKILTMTLAGIMLVGTLAGATTAAHAAKKPKMTLDQAVGFEIKDRMKYFGIKDANKVGKFMQEVMKAKPLKEYNITEKDAIGIQNSFCRVYGDKDIKASKEALKKNNKEFWRDMMKDRKKGKINEKHFVDKIDVDTLSDKYLVMGMVGYRFWNDLSETQKRNVLLITTYHQLVNYQYFKNEYKLKDIEKIISGNDNLYEMAVCDTNQSAMNIFNAHGVVLLEYNIANSSKIEKIKSKYENHHTKEFLNKHLFISDNYFMTDEEHKEYKAIVKQLFKDFKGEFKKFSGLK